MAGRLGVKNTPEHNAAIRRHWSQQYADCLRDVVSSNGIDRLVWLVTHEIANLRAKEPEELTRENKDFIKALAHIAGTR
jgi:hypothetical protein